MPYIKKEDRLKFSELLAVLEKEPINSAGELNYLLTMIVHKYLNQKPENYQSYNDAIGALEGCKIELYRRHISDYEDTKQKENGDV